MESLDIQQEKVQKTESRKTEPVRFHRWQKFVDGNGQLFIVTNFSGYFSTGKMANWTMIELLNVDFECTSDYSREQFEVWVDTGILKRVEGSIII